MNLFLEKAPYIIRLDGTLGVGKTTTADILSSRLENGAVAKSHTPFEQATDQAIANEIQMQLQILSAKAFKQAF